MFLFQFIVELITFPFNNCSVTVMPRAKEDLMEKHIHNFLIDYVHKIKFLFIN